MGGYSDNRGQNYEIKYLRKALLRVDNRIRVPESVSAESLRHLLDNVEQPAPRSTAKNARPRWLSLQSGIAYAAAFVLIVALFYSTRLYSPDMITGGLAMPQSSDVSGAAVSNPLSVADNAQEQPIEVNTFAIVEDDLPVSSGQAADTQTPAASAVDGATTEHPAVGGGGMATLLLEGAKTSYYWRLNDATDPDKAGFPCTLELVNNATGNLVGQVDLPGIQNVEYGFEIEDRFVIVGSVDKDTVFIVYDTTNPESPVERDVSLQSGELISANLYKDILRIVTLSDKPNSDIVELPHSVSTGYCVVGLVSPLDYQAYQKSFSGVDKDSVVQLHNLNAYIRYHGSDDNGGTKDYIAQVNFDGLDVELGTVS